MMKYGKGKKIEWLVLVVVLLLVCVGIPGACAATINVPGDYTMIQDAIDNASAGDVITVSAGTHTGYITVDKTLTLQGIGNPVIQGDNSTNQDVVSLTADNIIFDGFVVTYSESGSYNGISVSGTGTIVQNCTTTQNEGRGIYVYDASNVLIKTCYITNNDNEGVYLDNSTSCSIERNIIHSTGNPGIYIDYQSSGNYILNNEIRDIPRGWGITVYSSSGNTLSGNTITNCSYESSLYGMYGGMSIQSADNSIITRNFFDGNTQYALEVVDSDDVRIEDNILQNSRDYYSAYDAALSMDSSDNAIISNNTITVNEHRGLYLKNCRNNTLTDNTLSGNRYNFGLYGTFASYYDHQIDLTNTANGKPIMYLHNDVGGVVNASSNAATIYCVDCTAITIKDLALVNTSYGVTFWNTNDAIVDNVSISTCESGFVIRSSDNNTLTFSTVADASDDGIVIDAASIANRIYLNTISGSPDVSSAATGTRWNSSTPLLYYYLGSSNTSFLGNHWGGYGGTDSDGDGIGNTPYVISTDTDDAYPLITSHTAYTFAANQPPVTGFTISPLLPNTGDLIQFTDQSVDPDGTINTHEWVFGDGNASNQQNPQHQYAAGGWYTVVLNVTDDQGAEGNATATLFVHDAGPMTIWVPDNATTIQGAVNIARDGDTIMVRNGTYPESVVVNRSISLYGLDAPVLDANYRTGFNVTSDGCRIDGFRITNAKEFGDSGIRVTGDTPVLSNNIIEDGFNGVVLDGVAGGVLINNTCRRNADSGIVLDASNGNLLRNNTCTDNAPTRGEGQGYGIALYSSTANNLYFNVLDNPDIGTPGLFHNTYDTNLSIPQNIWYNTTLLHGNRYSDYYGEDTNGDGIGDTRLPYEIGTGISGIHNTDPYPLMWAGTLPSYAPVVSGISTSDITSQSAIIEWSITNQIPSDNRVLYGTDSTLAGASWSTWVNDTINPSVTLTGLASNTTYYYQCFSTSTINASLTGNSTIQVPFTTLQREPGIITVDDDNQQVPGGDANFSTILQALASAMDGDTILVYSGNYSGYHEVATRVNLTGIGWPVVTGDEDNTLDELGDVFALRADGCILDGFVIRDGWWHNQSGNSTTTDSAGVRIGYLSVPADDTIVRNNLIEDAKYGIIANSNSDNNTIHHNVINQTYHGVWLNNARTTLFANNTVTNMVYSALENTYWRDTVDNYATNNRIEYNTFDDAGWAYGGGYDDSTGREVAISDTGGNVIAHNTLRNQTYISVGGDGNTIEENQILGLGENAEAAIVIGENANIVRNNTVENHRFGIMLQTDADNLQMSGNTIAGCTYGFGFEGDVDSVSSRPSRNVIDTTNTVEGAPIYWIVGATGEVYNSGTPGYLALIGCSDIRVENLYPEKNAQSFFIYRSQNVTLDSVSAHGSALQGILIGDSDEITITGSSIDSNGYDNPGGVWTAGILANNMTHSRIVNSTVTANNPSGITFLYSCADNIISGCTVTNNGEPTDAEHSYGIRDYDSIRNTTVTGCTIGNTFANVQGIGIDTDTDDSLFYNNRFLNHTVAHAQNWGTGTRWNVTPVAGTNILGGPWIAGNYWDDYAGNDTNGDGLGDTELPYYTSGATPGQDHHPLLDTFVPDEIPPVIIIHTPAEGGSYPSAAVPLEVSSPDGDVGAWWYSLDAAANATFTPNITLPAMSVGEHTLQVWANDTSGNENSSSVTFTATVDITPPALYVTSPEENVTYIDRDIPLNVWSPDGDAFSWWYALDGGTNSTPLSPAAGTTLTGLANGTHTVAVFMDDIIGNTNATMVNFTVDAVTPEPEPTPQPTIADTGDDTPEPLDYPLPVVEEPAFLITILTPDAGQTVERQAEVTYSANSPLARAYYQLDGGAYVQVSPGRAIPLDRLTLGTHDVTVTGVDYFGRYGQGAVSFEVIPLAIGEGEPLGTTAYPDDTAVSFTGRAVNYTLSFEVETAANEEVSVYLNRQLAGVPGSKTNIVSSGSGTGVLLENVSSPSAGVWTMVTVPVPADGIVPDSENVISFVHTVNPERMEGLASWHIRNIALVPDLPASAPSIRVYTPDQSLGPGDEMMVWVEIAGIAPEDRFTARVYLVAPDGEIISFPDGSFDAVPLDDAYVRGNHYGRLPGTLSFAATDLAGTYHLVATLEPEGSDQLVSLSSVPVFFSADPAVRLYINRDILGDGMPLQVMHAATGGTHAEEETLVILMEHPDGSTTYLPSGTESYASRHYAPLGSLFETTLYETVDAGWDEGTYLIRSKLYNSMDDLVAQDIVTFTVSREKGTLTLSFPLSVTGGMPASSRIWLMDTVTLEIVAEQKTGTAHDDVTFSVPAGTYWYGGELTTGAGEFMTIPVDPANSASISPGETVRQRVVVQAAANLVPMEVIP